VPWTFWKVVICSFEGPAGCPAIGAGAGFGAVPRGTPWGPAPRLAVVSGLLASASPGAFGAGALPSGMPWGPAANPLAVSGLVASVGLVAAIMEVAAPIGSPPEATICRLVACCSGPRSFSDRLGPVGVIGAGPAAAPVGVTSPGAGVAPAVGAGVAPAIGAGVAPGTAGVAGSGRSPGGVVCIEMPGAFGAAGVVTKLPVLSMTRPELAVI
jgi:hypothetical protein